MGDTSRDPIDHSRTSRPRVGQTLKNPAKIPGLFFIAAGLVAFAICLADLALGQTTVAIAAGVTALVATMIGGVWLAREARRARALEGQQNFDHGDSAG